MGKVPEMQQFSQVTSKSTPAGGLIVGPRPGRTMLFVSVGFFGNDPAVIIGPSRDNGIKLALNASIPSVQLCYDDVWEIASGGVWNANNIATTYFVTETWVRPTGRCICDDSE